MGPPTHVEPEPPSTTPLEIVGQMHVQEVGVVSNSKSQLLNPNNIHNK